MEIRKGTIQRFEGSWNSGLGFLVIQDSETGNIESIPADNGPTVRALEGAFGNVIGEAHCVDGEGGHVNKEVYWSYDDLGLTLIGFTPADEAPAKVVELYESTLEELQV